MARKLIFGLSFSLMAFVLAGCITIPIGDNVLEISTDGIEFVSDDSSDENADENNDPSDNSNADNNNNNNNKNDDMNSNNDDANGNNDDLNENNDHMNNTGEAPDASNITTGGKGGPADSNCEQAMDHTPFTKHVNYDLYIPDCSELKNVQTQSRYIVGYFLLEDADWEEVYEDYMAFYESDGEVTRNESDLQGQEGHLRANLPDDGTSRVSIFQLKDGSVEIQLRYGPVN